MARKPGPKKGTVQLSNLHREKIQKSQILQRLISHAEGALPEGQEMTQSQVTAGIALLKKVLPDMTESMVKGDGDNGEITVVHKITRELIAP